VTDDIVTRLRREIRKRDREYPVELLPELREAADEIERLRKALSEIAENRDEPYAADHARDALKGAE
jgi:hypothetical protein